MGKVSGIILAGGLGRRLGGVDKGLALFRGKPLIEWVIERVAPQVDELFINANRSESQYATYGLEMFSDQISGFAGPLAGLQAGLEYASHSWVLSVPCDTPMLPVDLVTRLIGLADDDVQIVVAATRSGWQSTVALHRKALAPALQTYLASGGRQVREWISMQSHRVAVFESTDSFANLNTQEDFDL